MRTECLYAEHHDAECNNSENHYNESHFAESNNAECQYEECHYVVSCTLSVIDVLSIEVPVGHMTLTTKLADK